MDVCYCCAYTYIQLTTLKKERSPHLVLHRKKTLSVAMNAQRVYCLRALYEIEVELAVDKYQTVTLNQHYNIKYNITHLFCHIPISSDNSVRSHEFNSHLAFLLE